MKTFAGDASFVANLVAKIGTTISWKGTGLKETGVDGAGRVLVRVDPAFFRPAEVDLLLGNAAKVRRELGWKPAVKFPELVKRMVRHDVALLSGSNGAGVATSRPRKIVAKAKA